MILEAEIRKYLANSLGRSIIELEPKVESLISIPDMLFMPRAIRFPDGLTDVVLRTMLPSPVYGLWIKNSGEKPASARQREYVKHADRSGFYTFSIQPVHDNSFGPWHLTLLSPANRRDENTALKDLQSIRVEMIKLLQKRQSKDREQYDPA